MSRHLLLRPLPLALVLLFVAVAIGDLVLTLRKPPPRPPDLLADGALRFESWEPVLDLRPKTGPSAVELLPLATFDGSQWSAAGPGGRWVLGDGAGIELSLARGGHRTMVIECRAAAGSGARSLTVAVNGDACGTMDLENGWNLLALRLPEGTVRAGSNTVVLEISDAATSAETEPGLQVRRVGFFFGEDVSGARLRSRPAVAVDLAAARVRVRASGTLSTSFTVDDRVDALKMRYRFTSGEGHAEITVARPQGGGVGRDAVMRRRVAAGERAVGGLRFPLHGRRGEFRFVAEVDLGPQPGRFDMNSLRLVSEGAGTAVEDRRRR